ncbi:MAG: hypothetical protein LBN42_01145, partial [Oscillospiraceae bacterium]|nr:hypothetical protein [Oscillospiraceae bacterium]
MKRIISLVVSAAVAVTVLVGVLTVPITASATLAAYAVVQSKLSRAYTLKTHNDADFTATVKLNGNKLAINGRFVKYTLSGIYLTTSSVSKAEWTFDVSSNADGTCSTELTAAPTETSGLKNAYIRFVFKGNSNYTFKVTVEYDMIKKEWFFGDNGTEKNNQEYIKRAVTLGADALKDYILPDGTDTQILAVLNKLNDTVTKLTGSISGDYEKAARISEYIGNFMYYDHDSSHGITTQDSVKPSTVSISHILDTKRSVCVGYANMFAAMCELAGVKTLTIIGCVPTSQRTFWDITDNGVTALHNWNLFYADGAWHNVDSLWDAPTRGYNSGEYSGGTGSFPFYFDMTDAAFAQLHRIDTRAEYRDYKALLKDSPDGKDPNITVKTPDTATTKNTGVFTPP